MFPISGNDLPRRYGQFPLELANMPIVDIDPYYADKRTFMVVTKKGTIFRFSSCDAMFLLSPFNPIRRFVSIKINYSQYSGISVVRTILKITVLRNQS